MIIKNVLVITLTLLINKSIKSYSPMSHSEFLSGNTSEGFHLSLSKQPKNVR